MFSTVDPDADRSSADRRLDSARQRLTPELKWAAEKLDAMKKRTAQKRTSEVARQGDTEKRLAERAGDLARDGAGSQAMPGPAIDALAKAEQAAEAAAQDLKRGDAEKGLGHQREAQQSLEAAREALGGDPSDEAQGSEGSGGPSRDHTDIPNATAHKGPEDFRRRVLEGLGMGAPGRQRDAVRRYAEGLLR